MKIAEALIKRADIQTKISQLEIRLNNNAKVQSGETPAEDPMELICELDSLTDQLEKLIARINHTNSVSMIGDDTLTSLISRRDCLTGKARIMRNFLSIASQVIMRGSKTEITIKPSVNVAELQKKSR